MRSGLTHTGPVAEPARQNAETAIPTGLSGLGVHVFDRHEANTLAFEKQLESNEIPGKGDPTSQVSAPPSTMVARKRKHTGEPLHPI